MFCASYSLPARLHRTLPGGGAALLGVPTLKDWWRQMDATQCVRTTLDSFVGAGSLTARASWVDEPKGDKGRSAARKRSIRSLIPA
jgi:hypothetical protein